ncbi:MAG TPA: DUF6502 family protein [Candidatus Binataceae bacterium]|jgi:hypothetical protein|nr:DUF6502 family protein [Candidatus Binataceae bacterium]
MSEVSERLIWAATRTLRPMVKRLLQMGIPFGALELRLRELFVEVAESELALPDRRQTDSSISLVTGINRKEVKRIRSSKDQLKAPRSFGINQATSLVSRWMTDPETTDQHGRPRPLPYRARRGPSFMKLARKLTGDLAPGVLLNELVRSGAAELLEGDIVVLRGDAYVPKARPSEFLILGEDPAELIETILRNIFAGGKERMLQRKVYYDNLGADAMDRVRAEMRREGERFLRRINRLLSKYDRDRNPQAPGGERRYATLGVYFFDDSEKPAPPVRAARSKRTSGRKRK